MDASATDRALGFAIFTRGVERERPRLVLLVVLLVALGPPSSSARELLYIPDRMPSRV